MKDIATTLLSLYEARDKVKQDLYEITGLADIIRGATKVETATAQEIKSKFATLRLSDIQDDMARFARDSVKNICIIIANHFSLDTIKQISGVKLLTAQEKQQIQMQQQQMQQQYQQAMQMHAQVAQNPANGASQGQPAQPQAAPPAPPPISDEMQELLNNPTWEEVEQLLRNNPALSFKIDIEIDSTIKLDEEQEKQSRVEFLTASGQFMAQAGQIGETHPELMPLLGQMLLFGIRGFKAGKDLEGQFKVAINKMKKEAENPQQKPDPEQQKLQANMQLEQQRLQMQQQQFEAQNAVQAQNDARDAQREQEEAQRDYQFKLAEMQAEYEFKIKEMQFNAELDMKKHAMTTEAASKPAVQLDTGAISQAGNHLAGLADGMQQAHQSIAQAATTLAGAAQALTEHTAKPKTVTMKSHDGRILQASVV